MARLIREQLRNVVAITVLVAIAAVTSYVIFQEQRLRIPILEEKPFELKAEFQTAQAVVPGQGQEIKVAGVRVGDVEKVELIDGAGVVTFAVDRKFLPVYRDATILMRPTTGLKSMFFELDPGTRGSGEYEEGETVPMRNTAPDINFHEIIAALDADTQAYLRLLLVGAGGGLEGNDKRLGRLLGSLGPINRDLGVLNRTVAERRRELAQFTHNMNVLTTRVGQAEHELTRLVGSASQDLGAIGEQEPDVERLVSLLPETLRVGRETLISMRELATVLGPTFNDLRPFARNLKDLNASTRQFALKATPPLRDEIRPFVREARKRIPDVRRGATRFAAATPRLKVVTSKLNRLFNMAGNNPGDAEPSGDPGRDEGYLYWLSWLGHNTSHLFAAGDGNGFYRRVYLAMGCDDALALVDDPNPVVKALRQLVTGFTNPLLATLGC